MNWYIKLYKSGYTKALQLLKEKYKKFVMFDYKRKTINGKKTKIKFNKPNYLAIHHDLAFCFPTLYLDYVGWYRYFPKVNFSKYLTYCNIFEHYVLHVLIRLTPRKFIDEKYFFEKYRTDLTKSEIKKMLTEKHKREQSQYWNKRDFAGWSGIYKQIYQIFLIHYKDHYPLRVYKNYMQSLKEKDYKDFTEFWNCLPKEFKEQQKEINDFYDNKNFNVNNQQKNKKINKEIPAGKLINNLINVSDFNYSLCKRWDGKELFDKNGNFNLEKKCRTNHRNSLMLFTNSINAELFIKFFSKDYEFFNSDQIKDIIKNSNKLKCLLSKINNPANFIQFIRELGGCLYGCPPGQTLAYNDLINFVTILPVIVKKPTILYAGSNEIRKYLLKNNLPIPNTWEIPNNLSKKDKIIWRKNAIAYDYKKINYNLLDYLNKKYKKQ